MASVLSFLLCATLAAMVSSEMLRTCGSHFMYKGDHVFLSGANLPWINYARDFGNNQWNKVKPKMEAQFRKLKEAGGNTMRLFIHSQGESTPLFNSTGYPIASDRQKTLNRDIKDMLDLAQEVDIFVIPTLWNAAVGEDHFGHMDGLIRNWQKLNTYIEEVLKPLIREVQFHPAIGAWDIINEPEGMIIKGHKDSEPCYDTMDLKKTYAGWAGLRYNYFQILRFINWQSDAIKGIDDKVLVTVGAWKSMTGTNSFNFTNHYSDSCLFKAGKRKRGTLDFFQYHSYSEKGEFQFASPFRHRWSDYNVTKPIVIGEFWTKNGGGLTDEQLFEYVYKNNYGGAWSWQFMKLGDNQTKGMSKIQYLNSNGKIDVVI